MTAALRAMTYAAAGVDIAAGDRLDRTFNNGVGFVLVLAARRLERVLAHLRRRRAGARVIGSIVRGRRGLAVV